MEFQKYLTFIAIAGIVFSITLSVMQCVQNGSFKNIEDSNIIKIK